MEFSLVSSPGGVLVIIYKAPTGLLLLLLTVVQRDVRLPRPQLVVVQSVLAD